MTGLLHPLDLLWRVEIGRDPEVWPCQTAAVAARLGLLYCGSLDGEIEERSLRTGQLTGVSRERQLGEVGDLAIAHDNELVSFSAGIQRWRLDGSGPASRLIAPGAFTDAGYDDSGRERGDLGGRGGDALLGEWGLELGTAWAGDRSRDVPAFESAVAETDGGIGRIVVADTLGRMEELDPDTLAPTAAHSLAFDDNGSRLLATGGNSTVHLYDAATWARVGSIPTEGTVPALTRNAFLHPDGRSLVANSHYGVVEWTLDPETLAEAACTLAGRNLTRAEWATYFGDEPYRRTCDEFPAGT